MLGLYKGVGTPVFVEGWENDERGFLATGQYPLAGRWVYGVHRVPAAQMQATTLVTEFPIEYVPTQQIFPVCHYDADRKGKVRCLRCKRWFCTQCVTDIFLNVALINGQTATLPKPICTQCHAESFEPSMRIRLKKGESHE
jgi:hypothetical protein